MATSACGMFEGAKRADHRPATLRLMSMTTVHRNPKRSRFPLIGAGPWVEGFKPHLPARDHGADFRLNINYGCIAARMTVFCC